MEELEVQEVRLFGMGKETWPTLGDCRVCSNVIQAVISVFSWNNFLLNPSVFNPPRITTDLEFGPVSIETIEAYLKATGNKGPKKFEKNT